MEGLGEHYEIEVSTGRPPLLEGRLLNADTLRGRQARHPHVRLDCEDSRARFRQLRCCDTGPGADVERSETPVSDEARNE